MPLIRDLALRDELVRRVATIPFWWHSIDLGNGVVTPGQKTPSVHADEMAALKLPSLHGKRVLDIGAWDGFYSFAAERVGAAEVVALDHFVWSIDRPALDAYAAKRTAAGIPFGVVTEGPGVWKPTELPGKRGFDLAHEVLASSVKPVVGDFMEMNLSELGTFDVVLYLGVLYHMRHPLLSLERVAQLTREVAIIETQAVRTAGSDQRSLWEFPASHILHPDKFMYWWAPNEVALVAACHAAGFRKVDVVAGRDRVGEPAAGELHHYRAIVHAWK